MQNGPRTVLRNDFNKETFIFTRTDDAGDGDTEFTVEFRPAQEHLLFFSNFARLTAEHPEWFSEKGDPDFLLIAASLDRFRITRTSPGHLFSCRSSCSQ